VNKKLPFQKGKKPGAAEAATPSMETNSEGGARVPAKGKAIGLASKARAKAAKAESSSPKAKAQASRPLRGKIEFICSECYEDFVLPATYERETVTCPECMHVGKRPAEDFLRTVTRHKDGEKRMLFQAMMLGEMLLVASLAFIWLISQFSAGVVPVDNRDTFTWILGGAVLVLAGSLCWAVSRYEKNRWEIYF
jgi:hypothetical protein